MAGIYIHIPFCKQRCSYCDFYSNTQIHLISEYIDKLKTELLLRKNFLSEKPIETIYFGGGTPSLLSKAQINFILKLIFDNFNLNEQLEITIEINPDDYNHDKIQSLSISTPINRFSIGVQSFDNQILQFLNRRHTANQSVEIIETALEFYNNISIDLIYGIPGMDLNTWKQQLLFIAAYPIPHISAYHLGIEQGTPLYQQLMTNEISAMDEELSFKQYEYLIYFLTNLGYEQYEISNFSYPGFQSIHNCSYWQNTFYLGLGPSAHSFDGSKRYWNKASLNEYIKLLSNNKLPLSYENLSLNDKYNDYIMTRLRLSEGINLSFIENSFGKLYYDSAQKNVDKYLKSQHIKEEQNLRFSLTTHGKFIANTIISDFFQL